MEWGEFLKSMSGAGVNAAAGLLLSYAVAYWAWYNSLDPKNQRLFFIALCFVIPIIATSAAIATGEFGAWADWQTTWWPAIVAGFTASAVGTLAHTRKLK